MILGVKSDDDCEVWTEESQRDVAFDHDCEVKLRENKPLSLASVSKRVAHVRLKKC